MSPLENTTHTSLPPPRARQLVDGTGAVGRIDGNRVEFSGFADPTEAAVAAWVAYTALERRRAKSRREPPPYLERPQLYIVRSGESEWIETPDTRLARLVRPTLQRNPPHADVDDEVSTSCFGIEIMLPSDASQLMIDSSAHVIYLALRRSGLTWTIRSEQPALDQAGVTRSADEPIRSCRSTITETQSAEVENALIG
jgi:hypothetical protein